MKPIRFLLLPLLALGLCACEGISGLGGSSNSEASAPASSSSSKSTSKSEASTCAKHTEVTKLQYSDTEGYYLTRTCEHCGSREFPETDFYVTIDGDVKEGTQRAKYNGIESWSTRPRSWSAGATIALYIRATDTMASFRIDDHYVLGLPESTASNNLIDDAGSCIAHVHSDVQNASLSIRKRDGEGTYYLFLSGYVGPYYAVYTASRPDQRVNIGKIDPPGGSDTGEYVAARCTMNLVEGDQLYIGIYDPTQGKYTYAMRLAPVPNHSGNYVYGGISYGRMTKTVENAEVVIYFSGGNPCVYVSGGTVVATHGPEGSYELGSAMLIGDASFLTGDAWSTLLPMYSNPGSTDKACYLNVHMEVGDTFKVLMGANTWLGYESVNQAEMETNKGRYNFKGVDDGNKGLNIQCKTAGYYDIYVNNELKIWIGAH